MPIRNNRFLRGLFLFLLYLAGAIISFFFIAILPILGKETADIRHAETVWDETISGEISESVPWRNQYSRIFVFDREGKLLYWYIAEPERTPEDLEKYLEKWRSNVLKGKKIFTVTGDQFRKNFLYLWLTSGTPISDNGSVLGAVFLIQDIQIIQNAVIYFLLLYTVGFWACALFIHRYQRRKQQLEDAQRQYIDNITHQLKNPIATISALTESLSDGMVTDPAKQQMYYGRILNETQNQTHMIKEILELSRLQSGEKQFQKSAVDPKELFGRIVDRYSAIFEYSELTFEVDEELFSLPKLHTNEEAVYQILEILLDNALKYVQSGGTVRLLCQQGDPINIMVSDNGPGIPEKDQQHIFERFYRSSEQSEKNGSGLGLAIAIEIAGKLKEDLSVKSTPGSGTDFYLTIHAE